MKGSIESHFTAALFGATAMLCVFVAIDLWRAQQAFTPPSPNYRFAAALTCSLLMAFLFRLGRSLLPYIVDD